MDAGAALIIASVYKRAQPDPLRGRSQFEVEGKKQVVEDEPDTDLRDTEQIPLLAEGGIEGFFQREVLPYVRDAWIDESGRKIGFDISFTRCSAEPEPLHRLAEIRGAHRGTRAGDKWVATAGTGGCQ